MAILFGGISVSLDLERYFPWNKKDKFLLWCEHTFPWVILGSNPTVIVLSGLREFLATEIL